MIFFILKFGFKILSFTYLYILGIFEHGYFAKRSVSHYFWNFLAHGPLGRVSSFCFQPLSQDIDLLHRAQAREVSTLRKTKSRGGGLRFGRCWIFFRWVICFFCLNLLEGMCVFFLCLLVVLLFLFVLFVVFWCLLGLCFLWYGFEVARLTRARERRIVLLYECSCTIVCYAHIIQRAYD